jgi:hypothetical protein
MGLQRLLVASKKGLTVHLSLQRQLMSSIIISPNPYGRKSRDGCFQIQNKLASRKKKYTHGKPFVGTLQFMKSF